MAIIQTRNELIEVLQQMHDDDATQDEILDFLGQIAAQNGIRVCHEYSPVKLPSDEAAVLRVTLRGDFRAGRFPQLHYDCNGLIIDATTWRALSVPLQAPYKNFNKKLVNEYLSKNLYDIYPISDGTVVTIYYIKGQWALSSSNGYDVSELYWMGDKTYAEILFDLATRLYPAFVEESGIELVNGRLVFTKLNINCCYTIGFRHFNFHPLRADPEHIWQLQCYDVSGPLPVKAELLASLPKQVARELTGDETVDSLNLVGRESVNAAVRYEMCLYGFILRSKDDQKTGIHSSIMLESPLLQKVRAYIYDGVPRQHSKNVTNLTRLKYLTIRASLSQDSAMFLELFPQFIDEHHKHEQIFTHLINKIVNLARTSAISTAPESVPAGADCDSLSKIAHSLYSHIINHEKNPNPFHAEFKQIVADYVRNPEHVIIYMRIM